MTIISFLRPRMNRRPAGRARRHRRCAATLLVAQTRLARPGVGSREPGVGRLEVAFRNVVATDEDFSVFRNLHFDAADRCAHRSGVGLEGMIQGHDGRGLGEAVSLDHHEAKALPELLELGPEWGRADDECPVLVAERTVDAPVPPPPRGNRQPCRRVGRGRVDSDHVVAEHVQDLRHADDDRYAPLLHPADDVVRVEAAHEDDGAVHERRNVRGHRLAEQMAEGQQVEESQRQEGPRVGLVPGTSFATGTRLASRLLCRTTTPFGSAVAPDVNTICATSSRVIATAGQRAVRRPVELVERPEGEAGRKRLLARATIDVGADTDEFGADDARHTAGEVGRRAVVDGDDDDAGDDRAPVGSRATPRSSRPTAASCRRERGRHVPAGRQTPARPASPVRR